MIVGFGAGKWCAASSLIVRRALFGSRRLRKLRFRVYVVVEGVEVLIKALTYRRKIKRAGSLYRMLDELLASHERTKRYTNL